MTLAPPRMVYPGACTCDPEGCICAPQNLGELMVQAQIAKLRADAAEEQGDHAAAARHRAERDRLGARIRAATQPQPASAPAERHDTMTQQNSGGLPPGHTRQSIIGEIQRLTAVLVTRHDAAEDLTAKSDAYLTARYQSLIEWQERERTNRANAVRRSDAVSIAATLRFDAHPNDGDYREARARVFASAVPEMERDSWVWRVATHLAWVRARDRLLSETVQARMDSLGEPEPNELDRLRAARDLEGRGPLGAAGRSDAFAAMRHERAVEARARQLAAERVRAEAQAAVRVTLPPAPPEPRLPLPPLPHAHLRAEADAEELAMRRKRS